MIVRDEPLFFLRGGGDEKFTGTNNFFFSYKHTNNFFSGKGFANDFFFIMRSFMLLYYSLVLPVPPTE